MALATKNITIQIYFLPEASTLPDFVGGTQSALYQWLACGKHPDNPEPSSRCTMSLPAAADTVSSQALSSLQAVAAQQGWSVDPSRLAYVKLTPDPSRS